MDKALPYIFFMAWMLCGCSVETFFDGGAPVAIVAAVVAVACAMVMSGKEE